MFRYRIAWVTFCIALILLALLGVQVFWIRNSFDLKEQEIYRTLDGELASVARQVEDNTVCFNMYAKSYFAPGEGIYLLRHRWKDDRFLPGAGNVDTVQLFNLFPKRSGGDTMIAEGNLMFPYPITMDVSLRFHFLFDDTSAEFASERERYDTRNITMQNYRERLRDKRDVSKLLSMPLLDSLIRHTLVQHGLPAAYEMGFCQTGRPAYVYLSPRSDTAHLNRTPIKAVRMLSANALEDAFELRVAIAPPLRVVLRSMMAMLISSGLIVVTLVLLFVYFMATILRQKKYNQLKTDFISNMTHEFKTPLTNISLALENLDQHPDRMERYLRIIGQENEHMQENVERILQIALLEKKELKLRMEAVDLHDLLHRVARTFDMQLDGIGGRIVFELNATPCMVNGDETHLINIFYNLLDNAIKYRGNQPLCVRIRTNAEPGKKMIAVEVNDNGSGMNREVQKRIFEDFYRGSSGNIHDTKGFGIGLGYVRHVMEAHKGTVTVQSEPGTGSTFRLLFPVV